MTKSSNLHAYIALVLSIIGFTFGAATLKLAQLNGVPSTVIVSWRLLVLSGLMTPLVLIRYRGDIKRLERRDLYRSVLTGVLASVHFLFIIESLRYTSVIFNQVIANTGPVWVALLEVFLLHVALPRKVWVGLLIAILGAVLIFIVGISKGTSISAPDIPLGNLMALIGAILGAFYIIAGRTTRQKVSIVPYLWIVYGIGGIVALIYNIVTSTPLIGYTPEGYFWIVMVILFPTLIGHTAFNYALGYMPATVVTLSGQAVILTASVVAIFAFHEVPTLGTIAAGAVIVVGVVIAIIGQRQNDAKNVSNLATQAQGTGLD